MDCTECGSQNSAGSKFCAECGQSLAIACPSCGTAASAGAKFCVECGTALGEARPTAAATPTPNVPDGGASEATADRRFVSVLFADLVDYTSLAEARDSDEVRDLLTVYFDRSRAIIEKFGGVVEKFIGDAIFGVWGSAAVREDDAERAVRAGLELVSMVDALGRELGVPTLALRAGVMSGSTTVGSGGNESTGMIVGDLVNTAARLQSVADPGTVFVGRATFDVTSRSIAYDERGELRVKGKAESVAAWRALRPAGRLGAEANLRELPFVGRDREMRLLTDWLDATTAEGRARLVAISGEAGIGKSRLAKEFLHHVDGYADSVYWHQGRSPSYGDGVPMWSIIEMVRQRAGILEDEEPGRARTRLRTMLAEYVDDAAERQWIDGWLTGLLALGDLPAGSRSELLSAVRSLFQHISRRGTTVLVFEDIHWADDSVIEFVTDLVDRSTRAPILVIALARPELLDRHPAFGSQRASARVGLGALADDALRTAVDEYLGGDDDELVDWIVQRAAGFPLYAAEILRMLLNNGTLVERDHGFERSGDFDQSAIPDTLQAVIGARIDRLDPMVLDVLQDAAVLGLSFHGESLRAFGDRGRTDLDEALRTLVRLDIVEVVDDPRSPERGQYRFVQGLIRELAYDRLHRGERRARHLAAADHFAAGDDPEHAGVVAKHYLGAHDSSPAGPEREALVQRAIDSLVTAAERSASLHADRAALDLYDRAIELAPPGVQVAEWCIAASRCATACSGRDQALAYLDRAEDLMRGSDGGDMPARIALARGFVYNTMFESGEALRVIEPVYLALDDVDDELSLAIAAEAARAYSLSVRIPEAVAAADRALPVAERLDEVVHAVELLITRGTTLSFSGRAIEGTANLVGAYEIATQQGLLDQAVRAANNIAALMRDAHWPSVHEWVQRLDEMCARLGVPEWSLRVRFYEVIESMFDGRCNDAIAALEEWSETEPDEVWARLVDWFSAAAAARLGRPGAIELLLDKLEYLRSTTDPQSANLLHFHDAVVASWRSDWQGALDASRRAIGDSHVAMVMFHAAARLGLTPSSLDALRADHFPAITGPMRTAHRALFDAAQRVIDGDTSAAAHALDRAIALLEGAAVAEDVMWARAAAIALLGAGHPQAERHASWIRAWIRDHELWGFVPMLDGVVDIAVDGDVRVAG